MHTIGIPIARPGHSAFLTFELDGLEYGIDFRHVREVCALRSLARFEADGEIVKGVALVRDVIMPIVDMRAAFGARPAPDDPLAEVIILKLSCSTIMSMVVDAVGEVVTVRADQIAPIPGAGSLERNADYLIGLGEVGARSLILIDIDKLMSVKRAARHAA